MKRKDGLKPLAAALKKYDRFLLSCHVIPEGDAIGSMLAMQTLLQKLGKKTMLVCQDSFPERLSCLSNKGWQEVRHLKSRPEFEAMVLTDCPTLPRIGSVKSVLRPSTVIFNIDHHISNSNFGHFNYIRPDAAATAEVVYDIYEELKVPINKETAKNLYVGLATDTGSFKYSNTTARSHEVAARLIATGINIEKINDDLHGTYSLSTMKLYSRLLGRVRTAGGGSIGWVGMKREDLKESGATHEDAEGFIDFLRYIKPVKVAFFMSELGSGKNDKAIRVSFRAKGPYDVNKVATHFNGGGHKKAAGCTIHAPMKEAERRIVETLRKEFHFS
ncbi:MAG TPA: bifunctional oligoribonuclease/PAP phosphatase NrnA [Verrucomicrobiae bacterium]|nr:bifunctional oligoribonuclease/PAP phosphatase NrnA [Verrucomicrobiae bacterium]